MFSAAFPAMLRSCRVSRSVCLRIGKTGPLMSFSYYNKSAGMYMDTAEEYVQRCKLIKIVIESGKISIQLIEFGMR